MTEEKKLEETAEEVAKRLREKIRSQAEDLLTRVDNAGSLSGSRHESTSNSRRQSATNLPSLAETAAASAGTDPTTTNSDDKSSTPARTSSGNNNIPGTPSSASSSNELTKRLQQLALERQKVNAKDQLKIIQSDTSSHLVGAKTFQELKLPEYLLKAIFQMGFDRPSAIQEETLPRILDKRNVIGQAQSGSGKTAAFTLGMLYAIDLNVNKPQALCVTPTRELAIQIVDNCVKPMSALMDNFKVQLAISQVELDNKRSINAHMVVGTPGKIVSFLKRKVLKTDAIKVFVLDEADHMVEENSGSHRANSLLIQKQLPKSVQTLLFSATFPKDVINFASKLVPKCDKILLEEGKPEDLVLDVIKQLWIDCRKYHGGKLEFLADIYSLLTIGQSIVFVGRKDEADKVHQTLSGAGFTCSVLHGAIPPEERDSVMEEFRKQKSNVLITTNVLARGVDVDNVCLVVNYDVPIDKDNEPDFETYLHRIGRTGRFGRKGTALNLIADQASLEILAKIEQHFSSGKELIQQADADPEALAELIEI